MEKGGNWDANLRVINRRFPEVAEKLLSLPDDLELADKIVGGHRTAAIVKPDGVKLSVQSTRPEIETARWLDGQKLNPTVNVVLLGMGLGHPLAELYRRSDRRDLIAVVEKSPALMRKALQMVDLSEPLSSRKVLLFLDEERLAFFRKMRFHYQTIIANKVTCVSHPITFKIHQSYYFSMRRTVHDLSHWAKANLTTLSRYGLHFSRNMLANLPEFAATPGVDRLFGKFAGVPAVIIAAGPSLGKNFPYLQVIKGSYLLIAVDTIIRGLEDAGIEPDLVVSIDFTAHTRRYFEGVRSERTALAYDPEVLPDIPRSYKGPRFAIDLEAKPIMDWARRYIGPRGLLPKGLSVAHAAFSLALEMGCDPIVFVGQDLAFSGRLSHWAGSLALSSDFLEKGAQSLEEVEGVFGREVRTSKALLVFLRHFEEMLEEVEPTVIDATEGGARIRGTEVMTLKETMAEYRGAPIDIAAILDKAGSEEPEVDLPGLAAGAKRLYRSARRVKDYSREVSRTMNRLEQELSGGPRIDSDAVVNLRRKWRNLIKQIREEGEVLPILEYNLMDVMLKLNKRSIDSGEELSGDPELSALRAQVKRDGELFRELEKSASVIEEGLKELLERLGEEDAEMGDLVRLPLDDKV